MSLPIAIPIEKIEAFCRKWKVQRLWLFGSVLREDFGPESDVDVMSSSCPKLCGTFLTWSRRNRS